MLYATIFFVLLNEFQVESKLSLEMASFYQCPQTEKIPIQYHEAILKPVSPMEMLLNCNMTIRRDLTSDLESFWMVDRCVSREAQNTCIQVFKARTSYCKMINSKGEIWSSMIHNVQPKWQCPHKKGFYQNKNASMDLALFRFFPLQTGYWKFKNEVKNTLTKEMVACGIMEGNLRKV